MAKLTKRTRAIREKIEAGRLYPVEEAFELLKEVGKTRTAVLLKRGMSSSIDEWLAAAEYILAGGNERVMLCERGIRTFETATRNTLDLSAVVVAMGGVMMAACAPGLH